MRRSLRPLVLPASLFVVAFAVRLAQSHDALLYPDGYQYLLMARGIAEHLQPTTVLGPSGDVFAPNADAAAKPFYPLLVAGVHTVGASWLEAARLVTAAAAAWVVVAVALLTTRLSGSQVAGIGAGLVLLASPALALWSGFSGPDPVAQALALSAALSFAHTRPRLAGVLTGLAVCTRPELALLALAAAVVGVRWPGGRHQLKHAAPAAVLTVSTVLLVLRPPVTVPDPRLLVLVPPLLLLAGFAARIPVALVRPVTIAALILFGCSVLLAAGPGELWRHDWPLLLAAAAGGVVLLRHDRRVVAAAIGAAAVLGAVYALKNPSLERYFALLLPLGAVLAGTAVGVLSPRLRPAGLTALGLIVVAGVLRPIPGGRDYDMFAVLAARVGPEVPARSALVTAAPDAYGFLLPQVSVRELRAGERGAILLDAAQRLYRPHLSARGAVVARFDEDLAFVTADGSDADAALLVAGTAVAAGALKGVSRPR
jgi:hypothetical protein